MGDDLLDAIFRGRGVGILEADRGLCVGPEALDSWIAL